MSQEEFNIYAENYFKTHHNIVSGLIAIKPKMRTKEASKFISRHRTWLSENRELFDGRVINGRGDLEFDTMKLVEFRKNKN